MMNRLPPFALAATAFAAAACGRAEGLPTAELSPPALSLAAAPAALLPPETAAGFVDAAGIVDLYMEEAAQLAVLKASDPTVRSLASELARRAAGQEDLKLAALAAGAAAPTSLDHQKRAWILELRQAQGAEFDSLFVKRQAEATEEALQARRAYLASGGDQMLRAYASNTLAQLRRQEIQIARLASGAWAG